MKTVAILGSTGSIGTNTLRVISHLKDKFKIVALASKTNASLLAGQINRYKPKIAAILNENKFSNLKKQLRSKTRLLSGATGIDEIAACGADIVVMAISGSAALLPTLLALQKSKRVALANKESLVMAGDIIMEKAKSNHAELIPVDSEHSAIFQCLKDENSSSLDKIYLTGSGGPLKDVAVTDLEFIEPDVALRHPRWKMGKKITIDSATLMNKGFEVIEAHYLFGIAADKIQVLIHPEALVHSMVQYRDGTIIAQLGITDMSIPIQYALTYPQRMSGHLRALDFTQVRKLQFHPPDLKKFPCLALAMEVAKKEGLAKAVLCAADEECVWAYLKRKIKINDIAKIIYEVLSKLKNKRRPTIREILQADLWAREKVRMRI